MPTRTQHTETPWRVGQTRDGEETFLAIYNDPEQVKIARVETWVGEQERAESEANAALIVRACNSHAALIAACEAAQQLIGQLAVLAYTTEAQAVMPGGLEARLKAWVTRPNPITAALALANGGQP